MCVLLGLCVCVCVCVHLCAGLVWSGLTWTGLGGLLGVSCRLKRTVARDVVTAASLV